MLTRPQFRAVSSFTHFNIAETKAGRAAALLFREVMWMKQSLRTALRAQGADVAPSPVGTPLGGAALL